MAFHSTPIISIIASIFISILSPAIWPSLVLTASLPVIRPVWPVIPLLPLRPVASIRPVGPLCPLRPVIPALPFRPFCAFRPLWPGILRLLCLYRFLVCRRGYHCLFLAQSTDFCRSIQFLILSLRPGIPFGHIIVGRYHSNRRCRGRRGQRFYRPVRRRFLNLILPVKSSALPLVICRLRLFLPCRTLFRPCHFTIMRVAHKNYFFLLLWCFVSIFSLFCHRFLLFHIRFLHLLSFHLRFRAGCRSLF